jgi:hypothetical protein
VNFQLNNFIIEPKIDLKEYMKKDFKLKIKMINFKDKINEIENIKETNLCN